ncbi:transposable element Tcb1 transposase [Trichonephila clavipes]|nr:transposable element Tcb1 transposase [Trichonephila clavipes]
MDDNATCHRTLAVQDCLDSEGIQRLVWPARSPDLNPIANVWDVLGRQVAGRNYPPTNKNTLIREPTEEWDKLPQQLLDNVVQRMALTQEKAQCLLWFHETKSPINVPCKFLHCYRSKPPDAKSVRRWYEMLKEFGNDKNLLRSVRHSVSEEVPEQRWHVNLLPKVFCGCGSLMVLVTTRVSRVRILRYPTTFGTVILQKRING